MSSPTRKIWKDPYRVAKKQGIRGRFAGVSGTGAVTLIKEAAKDEVKRHAKRYIGGILIDTSLTRFLAGLQLLTNATKVVKYSKACHSVCATSWRAAHNIAELPLIFVNYAVFGEYVPSCGEADYDLYSNTTDVFKDFTQQLFKNLNNNFLIIIQIFK